MSIQYIQDQTSLTLVCQQYEQSPVLTIDTEFVRTRTLYPKLGLLQISDGKQISLIDPISIEDLSPFWSLLTNANITKVLHACSEDLEVFLTAANCRPVNLIDTQVMMSFLGHGLSMGYAAMIKHYLDIELDKSESRTDWTKRPLSERQLAYAQADVKYLFDVYPTLLKEIEQAGWLAAAEQETHLMIEKKFSPINADEMYRAVKMGWRLNPTQLNRLKSLATWRYQQAQKRDLPISFIAKDHTLMALAQYNPANVGKMASLEGIDVLDVRHKGKVMLNVLKKAEDTPVSDYPEKIIRLDEYPGYKQIYKKVKNFVSDVATESGLTPENLASKKQINHFLSWHFKINNMAEQAGSIDILLSWRRTLFGEKLIAFAENNFK